MYYSYVLFAHTTGYILCTSVLCFVGGGSVKPSQLLKSGNISGSGSTIVIYCEFLDVVQEASCVLVYKEYSSPLLTVVDIPQLLHFPISLAVDNPENYTFALFGKHPVIYRDGGTPYHHCQLQ